VSVADFEVPEVATRAIDQELQIECGTRIMNLPAHFGLPKFVMMATGT